MRTQTVAALLVGCFLIVMPGGSLLALNSEVEVEEQVIYSGEGFEGLRGSECSISVGVGGVLSVAFPAYRESEAFPYVAIVDGDQVEIQSLGPGGRNVLCLSLDADKAGLIHACYTYDEYNPSPGEAPHTGHESNLTYSRQTATGWTSEHVIQRSPELVAGRIFIDDEGNPAIVVWSSGMLGVYRKTAGGAWQHEAIERPSADVTFLDAVAMTRGELAILFTVQLRDEEGYELRLGFLRDSTWSETVVARSTGLMYANPRSMAWRGSEEMHVLYTAGENARWEDARVYHATCVDGSCSVEGIAGTYGLSGGIAVSSSGELFATYASFEPPLRFGDVDLTSTIAIQDADSLWVTLPIRTELLTMPTGLEVAEAGLILVGTQTFSEGGDLSLVRIRY